MKSFQFRTFNSLPSHSPVTQGRGNLAFNDFLFYYGPNYNVELKGNQFSSVTFYENDKNSRSFAVAAIAITLERGESGLEIGYQGNLDTMQPQIKF